MSAYSPHFFVILLFPTFLSNNLLTSHIQETTDSPDNLLYKHTVSTFPLDFLSQPQDSSKVNREEAVQAQLNSAKALYEEKNYNKSLSLLRKVSTIDEEKKNLEHFEVFRLIGEIHSELNEIDSAIVYFKKAIAISDSTSEEIETSKLVSLYNSLANHYRLISDYLRALEYFNQELVIIEKDSTANYIEERIKAHIGIGKCYRYLFKKEKAIEHFNIAFKLIPKLPELERRENLINVYEGLGRTFNYFDDYENAIMNFKSSISNCIEEYGYLSEDVALKIDLLGNSYYYLKDYYNAIRYFEESLEILKKIDSRQRTIYISNRYSKIGACYTNLKLFDKASYFLDKSIEKLNFNSNRKHPFENLLIPKRTHLLITLYFKAKNHQKAYEAGWGQKQLYEADRWFGLCIELIEYINSTFEESGSKQYLLDRFYYVFEAAINSKYHLYQETGSLQYLEQAFGYAERSKALLLKEAMQLAGASLALGIPEGMLEAERRLNKAIIEKENRRYELKQRQEEQQAIHELNNEIFRLKQKHHRILDSIRQQYPKAHRFRYTAAPLTPGQIQDGLLSPGQALLQYFLGEENIFLFIISTEEATLIKHPVEEGLAEAVEAFRESIYGWSQSQEDSLAGQYAGHAFRLYQCLIQPVAHLLPEHLIIIPDGILEYIPFEALLKEPIPAEARSLASYPYFIRSHQVSYAHSAQLLQEMKEAGFEAPRKWVLAFAPSFQDPPGQDNSLASRRRNLGRLTSNVKEVQYIKKLLRTRIYKGKDATRERFLADAPHYGIIHLATHAKANDEEGEYSYLAFTEIPDTLQNELLYAKDLYSMRLPADMVVLSACESGIGELRRGEGVISLARGFSYAGARSLATTLWRVSDRESAALMRLFYEELKAGKPKDEALRAAKLEFISRPGGAQAHPFFWAAFILSGDMAPIEVSGPTFPAWVYVLLIGLFVFLALRFAKRKPS